MPNRTLADIGKDLAKKSDELAELSSTGQFRPTVDNTGADLAKVTDFIDETTEGIEGAGKNIKDNVEALTKAVDGMKDLLGDQDFTAAVDNAVSRIGGAAGDVRGGLESTTNVLGKVSEGLGKLTKAIDLLKQVDDLANAEGAEQLEQFADAFETVVEELGPLVDKVPALGAFFKVYAAGIRNIAISARAIQDRVNELNSIYRAAGSDGAAHDPPLYMTQEWFTDQHYRKVQAEYDTLVEEAMNAARAEREERDSPPPEDGPDTASKALHTAMNHCERLEPDRESNAYRRWLAARLERDSARTERSDSWAEQLQAQYLRGPGLARATARLAAADTRLARAEARFERDGAEWEAREKAYNDCIKDTLKRLVSTGGLNIAVLWDIGLDHPQWDVGAWRPAPSVRAGAAEIAPGRAGPIIGTGFAVAGAGLILALGMTAFAGSRVTTVEASAEPAAAAPTSSGTGGALSKPWEYSPWTAVGDPLPPAIGVADPDSGVTIPAIVDRCVGVRHGSGSSTISIDVRVSSVQPGASVTVYTRSPFDEEIRRHDATIDENGYARIDITIFDYGTHEILGGSIDPGDGGELTQLTGADFGGDVTVTGAQPSCDAADLAPAPPEPVDEPTPTIAVAPGGGVVERPPTDPTASPGTVVTPSASDTSTATAGTGGETTGGTELPDTPDDGAGSGERALGLGLVAAATAGLAGAAGGSGGTRPSLRTQPRQGPTTYSAEDRAFLQEIYEGAADAGVDIVGRARIDSVDDALAGSKANPVTIGKSATLYLRIGADGELLPQRGVSDTPAATIRKVDVRPGVEFDGDGDRHVVWHATVSDIDTTTAEITRTATAGPTNAEWDANVGERSWVDAANDPAFKDWVVDSMPSTPGEAVRQALSR